MNAARISTTITTSSACVLGASGMALLFASDELLPRLLPGTPVSAAVLGQLVAAGWLAVAWLGWNRRHQLVGGIYGRPMALAHLLLYLVTTFSLAHPAMEAGAPLALRLLTLLFGALALVYAALLLRGPFGTDAA
jgi:hypothetical protein